MPTPVSQPAPPRVPKGAACPWRKRAGAAGLIMVIVVLGYMMNLAMSHSYMIQTEFTARRAREYHSKAYFAAMAGVNFAIACLRTDVTNTFGAATGRLYFAKTAGETTQAHYCTIDGINADKTFSGFTQVIGSETFQCTNPFSINTETNATESTFILSTYPNPNNDTDYFIKCQGTYTDSATGNRFSVQVKAKLRIESGSRFLMMSDYKLMGLQGFTPSGGSPINDFYDWEEF